MQESRKEEKKKYHQVFVRRILYVIICLFHLVCHNKIHMSIRMYGEIDHQMVRSMQFP